jgi:hypothetical protein
MTSLFKYEDNNVDFYSEQDVEKRILTNPDVHTDLKDKVESTFKGLRNPYREAYLVLKGELLDLQGMGDAITGREQVVRMQSACASKMRSDREEMEKLQSGKTTIKSIFKSSKGKENEILALQAQIEVANKDL